MSLAGTVGFPLPSTKEPEVSARRIVAENPASEFRSVNNSIAYASLTLPRPLGGSEEKGSSFPDGTTNAVAELVAFEHRSLIPLTIVEPVVGVVRRIPVELVKGTVKIVGSDLKIRLT